MAFVTIRKHSFENRSVERLRASEGPANQIGG